MAERDSGSYFRKHTKLAFSETQRVYREGVENLIGPMLDDPESDLSKQLEAGDSALVDAGNDGGVRNLRRLIPIAMPIDYKLQKQQPENAHNMAQIYFSGAHELDETLPEVGDYYFSTRKAVRQNAKKAFGDALAYSNNPEIPIGSFEFTKPLPDAYRDRVSANLGGTLLRIRQLVRDGADYKRLRDEGFSSDQIGRVRGELSKRREVITVPGRYRSWGDVIAVLKDPEIDRIVKRELILEIPLGIFSSYSKKVSGKEAVFASVAQVAERARLSPNARRYDSEFLADYLVSNCLPVGYAEKIVRSGNQQGQIQRYWFVLFADSDQCVGIFDDAKDERFDWMRQGR